MNKYLIGFIIIVILILIYITYNSTKKEGYYRTYINSSFDPRLKIIDKGVYDIIQELNAVEKHLMTTLSVEERNKLAQRRMELLKKIDFSYNK